MRKKCYFIGSPGVSSAVGGYFSSLGAEIARSGDVVKIISPRSGIEGAEENENCASLRWPSPRPTRMADALFLASLIRRYRPDCLVANFAAVNWMCLVGSVFRVKHRIAFYHTLSSQIDRDNRPSQTFVGKIQRLRKRLVYKSATGIVGISRAALHDAQKAFGIPSQKCMLWRYSIPDPSRKHGLRSAREREDVIVCAGRLHPSKGQDVLIRAISLGGRGEKSTRIEFLGAGSELSSLRQLVEKEGVSGQCDFVGSVTRDEVVARMARAKATIVPSRNEAFGLVNIESMSVGTPVIASRVDGIQEIVRDGVDGYLVPPDNPVALCERLYRVIDNCDLREELGSNARRRFLETYEESSVIRKQAEWLHDLVHSNAVSSDPAVS